MTRRKRSEAINVMAAAAGPTQFQSVRVTKAVYGTGSDGNVIVAAGLDGT